MFSFRYDGTSYNIRRSVSILVVAVIGTRPDCLTGTYKDVSPVPISCFGDREETVYSLWQPSGLQGRVFASRKEHARQ